MYQIEWWWNKICWIRDYQRWHTIHIQIMMIRHRMRCVVDSLSWWIGVQSITSIYLMYSYRICMISSFITSSISLIHLSSYPSSQFSLFSSFNPLFFHYEQWMKWYDMKLSIHDSRMNEKIVSFIINKYNQYLSILHN